MIEIAVDERVAENLGLLADSARGDVSRGDVIDAILLTFADSQDGLDVDSNGRIQRDTTVTTESFGLAETVVNDSGNSGLAFLPDTASSAIGDSDSDGNSDGPEYRPDTA